MVVTYLYCSDRHTSQLTAPCQQTGIILSVEALQCMLAKLAGRSVRQNLLLRYTLTVGILI